MPKPIDKQMLDRTMGGSYKEVLASIILSSHQYELSLCAAFEKLKLGPPTGRWDVVSDGGRQGQYLLELPGEILNLIYGFVLTFDHTLVCRETQISKRPVRSHQLHVRLNDERQYHSECINEPDKDGGKSFRLYLSVKGDTEANQMKYVCRQLRSETKGLELKYNTIAFVQEEFDSWSATAPLEKCSHFFTSCGPAWLQCISRVVILHHSTNQVEKLKRSSDGVMVRPSTSDAAYSQIVASMKETSVYKDACNIADFCTRHPSTIVEYYDPRFSLKRIGNGLFFWYGIFQKMARGVEVPTSLVSARFLRFSQNNKIRPGSRVGVALEKFAKLPNFRYLPSDTLDLDLLKTDCLLVRPTSIILPHIPGGIETLVREVQKWYEEGI